MEQTLRERQLAEFLDRVPMGILAVDTAGKTIYKNAFAESLLGQPVDQGIAAGDLPKRFGSFVAGTETPYPPERSAIARALNGEAATLDDAEIRRPDGVVFPLESSAFPIRNRMLSGEFR